MGEKQLNIYEQLLEVEVGQTKAGKVENQMGMTVKKLTKKNNQNY